MSDIIRISNRFWKQNPLKKMSTAQISYFSMAIFSANELNEKMSEIIDPSLSPERLIQVETERKEIAALDTGESVVKFMRHEYDIINRNELCRKTLEMQDDVMPLILRRYRTSAQTVFIETAALIFAYCDARYAIELREIYPNIRDPYARSAASVALGFQEDDEAIPMLLREYEQLRRDYPEESYDQGPLLALYHLYGKL